MCGEDTFRDTDWDTYARCYDALAELRPYQDMLAAVVRCVPKPARSVLDLGCGTGSLLHALQKERPAVLTGIDNSPQMLAVARQKLPLAGVQLRQSDLEGRPDWGDNYDCVVSSNVLYTLREPGLFLAHIRRTLAPGGTAVVVTPKSGYDNGLILKAHCRDPRDDAYWRDPHRSPERERMLIHEALGDSPLAANMAVVAEHNRRIAGTQHFHFFTEPALCSLMAGAGLSVETITTTYAGQNWLAVLRRSGA